MRQDSSEVPLSNKQVCCLNLCCSSIQVDFQDLTFQWRTKKEDSVLHGEETPVMWLNCKGFKMHCTNKYIP